jgi:GTP-binding protein
MGDHASPGRGLTANPTAPAAAALPGTAPLDDEAARVEAARLLFAGMCRFTAGAATAAALPEEGLPEIAFIGRSNVGKSSLVNALTGRRALARTSSNPGRTRQINFFDLAGRLALVDLPGYGYAEASKAMIRDWTALARRYLSTRATLRRACLLIDARHGLKDADRPILGLLDDSAVSYQIVLTKCDKPRAGELALTLAAVSQELARHRAAHPEIVETSAESGDGIALLRAHLAFFALPK